MLLDPSTIANLELLRNLRTGDTKKSLFGALNHCLTTAGTRCLRSSIIQPSVDLETISANALTRRLICRLAASDTVIRSYPL